jgi:5'-3' exonuclease
MFLHGSNPNYESSIRNHIENILTNNNATEYIGILDGKNNFRKDVGTLKVYKGNRKKSNLLDTFPYYFKIRDLLIEHYRFVVADGAEADDVVSILQNRMTIRDGNRTEYKTVIASTDKDLLQIEGYHYNIRTNKKTFVCREGSIMLTPNRKKLIANGEKLLFAQLLTGDTADNIPGLPKNGPVKAYKELVKKTTTECRDHVMGLYQNYYGDLEAFKENFRLVYILRESKSLETPEIIDYLGL